jgi:hypothetical protein
MAASIKELTEGLQRAKSSRLTWESLWQDCADYALPDRGDFATETSPGRTRHQKILDTTAPWALGQFASALFTYVTSPTQPWFNLRAPNSMLEQDRGVQEWLQLATQGLYDFAFQPPHTGFGSALHEAFLDIGGFGTCAVFTEDDPRLGVRYHSWHLDNVYIEEAYDGQVVKIWRCYRRTYMQLAGRFGMENLPQDYQEAVGKKPNDEVEIAHAIYPRNQRDHGRVDPQNMPVASVYFIPSKRHILEESGYQEMPVATGRWFKVSGETYGRSPTMAALPTIKMVNEIKRTTIKARQKSVDPPLQMPDQGFMMPIDMSPGALNYYEAGMDGRIEPIVNPQYYRADVSEQTLADEREQILKTFYVDIFQLPKLNKEMTATEVLQRREDTLRTITPMISRLQHEFLGPLIDRTLKVLVRSGRIPAPPEALNGVRINYTSPAHQAQKMVQLFTVSRLFESMAPMASIKPEIFDNLDADGAFRWVHSLLDAPVQLLLPPEVVAQLRQERDEQARAAQEAENMNKAAPALKLLQGGQGGAA